MSVAGVERLKVTSNVQSEYLNVNEVATRFRVSPRTVRRWLRQGLVRGIKLGAQDARGRTGWRIPLSEVERIEATGGFADDEEEVAA